eukprot:gnl/MRDRNA2_/MRDRNA2_126695_c0_seq1.p1 gnl/MRDRNA2_/MRDRNA2_126695_c0~~gnl/MRDRNA2_/MRDRNA2_126695_c0_seq1.p1  ORF type:complete len:1395 (+),score=246.95 gnl/MRDRNA2_/MRDRNA2_126695_c0_seq1:277-4185(+)
MPMDRRTSGIAPKSSSSLMYMPRGSRAARLEEVTSSSSLTMRDARVSRKSSNDGYGRQSSLGPLVGTSSASDRRHTHAWGTGESPLGGMKPLEPLSKGKPQKESTALKRAAAARGRKQTATAVTGISHLGRFASVDKKEQEEGKSDSKAEGKRNSKSKGKRNSKNKTRSPEESDPEAMGNLAVAPIGSTKSTSSDASHLTRYTMQDQTQAYQSRGRLSTGSSQSIRGHLASRLSTGSRGSRREISQINEKKPQTSYEENAHSSENDSGSESKSSSEASDEDDNKKDTRKRSIEHYGELFSLDKERTSWSFWLKVRCANLALDMRFEWLMGLFVTLNCICLGAETEISEGNEDAAFTFQTLERVFLAIFTLELLIVGYGHGIASFKCAQGVLDVFIVATGWFFEIILPLLTVGSGTPDLKWVQLVKMLRALRAVRVLRVLTMFDALWLTVQSFFMCLRPLAWTVLFILMIIYLFAMFAVGLIGRNEEISSSTDEELLEAQERFRSTVAAMVSLFQIMTLDEWYAIVGPLFGWSWWPYIFFIVYIAICALALMNLVTAVVVDGAMTQSEAETLAEQERKAFEEHVNKMVSEMEFIFNSFDQDGNGKLSLQEFVDNAMRAPRIETILSQLGCTNNSDIEQIFQLFCVVDSEHDGHDEGMAKSQEAFGESSTALTSSASTPMDKVSGLNSEDPTLSTAITGAKEFHEMSMNEFMQGMHLLQIISTDSAWVASIRSAPTFLQRTLRLKRAWDDKRPEGASNNLWEDFGQSKNDMEQKLTELESQISAMRKKNSQTLQDLLGEVKELTKVMQRIPPQPKDPVKLGDTPLRSKQRQFTPATVQSADTSSDHHGAKRRGVVGTPSSSSTDPVVGRMSVAIPAVPVDETRELPTKDSKSTAGQSVQKLSPLDESAMSQDTGSHTVDSFVKAPERSAGAAWEDNGAVLSVAAQETSSVPFSGRPPKTSMESVERSSGEQTSSEYKGVKPFNQAAGPAPLLLTAEDHEMKNISDDEHPESTISAVRAPDLPALVLEPKRNSEESIQRVPTSMDFYRTLPEDEEVVDLPGMFPACSPEEHLPTVQSTQRPGRGASSAERSQSSSSSSFEAVATVPAEDAAAVSGPLAEGDLSAGRDLCWISEGDLSAGTSRAQNQGAIKESEGDLSAGTQLNQAGYYSASSAEAKAGAQYLSSTGVIDDSAIADRSFTDRAFTPAQLDRALTPSSVHDEDLQNTRNEVLALTSNNVPAGSFMRWMTTNRQGTWQQHRARDAAAELRRQLNEVSAGNVPATFFGTTILGMQSAHANTNSYATPSE